MRHWVWTLQPGKRRIVAYFTMSWSQLLLRRYAEPLTATLYLAAQVLQCRYRRPWANGWFPEKQGDLEECRAKTLENYFKSSEQPWSENHLAGLPPQAEVE